MELSNDLDWLSGSIFSNDERVRRIALKDNDAVEMYERKFGKDSLDKTLEGPHPMTSSVISYVTFTDELERRVEENEPFELADEEFLVKMIF